MIPLTSPNARTKNQQLTPKLFCKVKCSGWNIVHNVPTGTLSRFHTASQALIWLASPRVPSFAFFCEEEGGHFRGEHLNLGCPISRVFCEKWGVWLIAHDKHELVVSVHSAPPAAAAYHKKYVARLSSLLSRRLQAVVKFDKLCSPSKVFGGSLRE